MSFIPNEISRVTSHAHSCIPDTSENLMNVQISYSWLYPRVVVTNLHVH